MKIKLLVFSAATILAFNFLSCSKSTSATDTTPTVDISVTRDKFIGSYLCTVPSSGASIKIGDTLKITVGSSTSKIILSKNTLEGTVSSDSKFILTASLNSDKNQKWSGDGSLVDKTLTFNLTISDPVDASQFGKSTLLFNKL